MNDHLATLAESIGSRFGERLQRIESRCGELTYEVASADLVETCRALRDEPAFAFEQLIDLTGVDYLDYGRDEWNTESATGTGFSRGVERGPGESPKGQNPRTERQNGDSPVEGQSRRLRRRLPPAVGHAPTAGCGCARTARPASRRCSIR